MFSMTGYGQSTGRTRELEVHVEIRTVNGRYLDVQAKLGREWVSLEAPIRKTVQRRLRRGRVDVFLSIESHSEDQYRLNKALAHNYLKIARETEALGCQGGLAVSQLLQLPGVLLPRDDSASEESVVADILALVEEALKGVLESRAQEGAAIQSDISSRVQHLGDLTEKIAPLAEELPEIHRQRLNERVQKLGGSEAVDPARLAQEILHYCDRSDISEEVTRLRAHLERFRTLLETESSKSLGKNLDFLCQELNREMNTILSKAAGGSISEFALDGKVEIERLREQVQNVE